MDLRTVLLLPVSPCLPAILPPPKAASKEANAHLGQLAGGTTCNLLHPERRQLGLQLVELLKQVILAPNTSSAFLSPFPLLDDALGLELERPDFAGGGGHGWRLCYA